MEGWTSELSAHAKVKIKAIYRSIRLIDRATAELFIDELQLTIDNLERDPTIGRVATDFDPTGQTLVVYSGGRYAVMYLIDEVVRMITLVDVLLE